MKVEIPKSSGQEKIQSGENKSFDHVIIVRKKVTTRKVVEL